MTGIFVLVAVIFVLMTAFPFLLAQGIPKEEQVTLVVRSDNRRDPRYFVHSFKNKIQNALEKGTEDGILFLSKPEPFFYGELLKEKEEPVDRLVICKKDFIIRRPMTFEKEIYSEAQVDFAKNTKARAVAAGKLYLNEGSTVFRWSDGEEEMYVYRGCDLGISASSAMYLQIMENCVFHRLFAPQIDILAQGEERKSKRVPVMDTQMGIDTHLERELAEKNIRVIEKDCVIKGNVITKYPLVIEEGVRIWGNVKSRKSILVKKGALIDGNVFADEKIVLQEQVYITGNVFSQQDIYVGPECTIGQEGKVKSVVAKENIVLCEDVTVYGYVGCEGCGHTVTRREFI